MFDSTEGSFRKISEQFVNNYFVLFYIGYLRQIEILGKKEVCANGSCLSILQVAMGGQVIKW